MQLFIIVVEYGDEQKFDSAYLDTVINGLGKNVKLTSKSYLLRSDASAVDIREVILNGDSDIDRIFVTACSSPSAWKNMFGGNADIKELLRNE